MNNRERKGAETRAKVRENINEKKSINYSPNLSR